MQFVLARSGARSTRSTTEGTPFEYAQNFPVYSPCSLKFFAYYSLRIK